MHERTNSDKVHALTNFVRKKLTQQICLGSKQSTMKNMPLPFVQNDNNISIIAPNEPVRNALMIGIKVKLIRTRHVD